MLRKPDIVKSGVEFYSSIFGTELEGVYAKDG